MLRIHQYRVYIMYKPGPDLYITGWLSFYNHTENKDHKMTGMNINVSAITTSINMPVCTSIEHIQVATQKDCHLQKLKTYITQDWL